MKKLFFLIGIAATFAAVSTLTGCTDEIVQPQTKSSGGELLSRGVYDYPAVEWDNVNGIAVTCQAVPIQQQHHPLHRQTRRMEPAGLSECDCRPSYDLNVLPEGTRA